MDKFEAKKRVEKLRKVINYHRYLYHVMDKQEISDQALDSLKKELFDLEQEYPDLISPDSPTQRIGGEALDEFRKIRHVDIDGNDSRMNSLNDAFSREDVEAWINRVEKVLNAKIGDFYCDLKMDGLAVELVYKKGVLFLASTRGDGLIGEDVTNNIKTIEAIPLVLENKTYSAPDSMVVRGEIFLNKSEFERINREQIEKGEKKYANPRNIAAGSVRQLNPKITAGRKLSFYAYGVASIDSEYLQYIKTHDGEYKILRSFGIPTNPNGKICTGIEEIMSFYENVERKRENLSYEIDGIVVSINNNQVYRETGIVGKAPRGAIAFKFAPTEAETVVVDIIVQVGRTGTLTPVAKLRPINVGGVIVSRATLHNLDEIRRLGVKIGDTVIVGRAGDVIPDIRQAIKELRNGREKDFYMPKKCPVCGDKIEQMEGQVAFKCINKNCPAIKRESMYHFVSRKAFDVDGVGPKIIDQLMDVGLINDVADLFSLEKSDLMNLERFGEKSAQNTIESIQSKKNIQLDKFIYSLGIEHVGEETAHVLAVKFKGLKGLMSASIQDLEDVNDIGPVVAKSIYNWFRTKYNIKLIDKLIERGISINSEISAAKLSLAGKKFVLTGSLETMTREEAKNKIRNLGGDISSTISKNTNFVVAGLGPGSKYDKAKKLGVEIINEERLIEMLQ